MSLSLEALTSVICATPTDEASFFSLAYVAALQQCTAAAYAPALHALSDSTKPTGVGGDAVADCIARVRLETERRVAGQQRTALLQEQATLRTADSGHRVHPTLSVDVDAPPALTAAPSQSTAASGRRRASSGPGGKHSRRASRRASSAAGSHSSGHLSGAGGAGGAAGARRGSREAAMDAAAGGGGGGGSSPASSSTPLTTEAAVRLLREGLVRAFGWSPSTAAEETNPASKSEGGSATAAAALTGLADAVLSRRTYAPLQSHEGAGSSAAFSVSANAARSMPPLYMELEDEEGRLDVVLEWMEDVLLFALHHGFSTPQTQAVLLDSVLLLRVVEDTSTGHAASEAAWEERVCEALQEVLCTQACPTVARVMEKVRQRQPVVREVPDPVQLAELEQKRLKATTAKALAAVEAALAGIPLVTQTVMEEVEIEVERDATLPALFSMVEAAAVVEFLTRSTVMHRQLWRLMTCGSGSTDGAVVRGPARPVVQVPLCAYVEDVPPVFLPPLSNFYPSRLQGEVDAQQSLYRECAAEKERMYAAKFAGPLGAIAAEEGGQRAALTSAAKIAAAADRDAALTADECVHVEHAFQLRLRDVVVQNARVARSSTSPLSPGGVSEGGAAAASLGTAASVSHASVADAVARRSKVSVSAHTAAASKSSVSASNMLGHSLMSADVAAAPLPVLVDAAFSLPEVERRVERVAAAAESMPSAGAAGAAGRGGPRKR